MDLSRQEYPGMLASLPPSEAVNILNDRVKRIGRINGEIADWLQERRKVEETYVQGLRKLARRQTSDESSDMGIFTRPWQKIVSSTNSLASSHHILAQKIEEDVERPLREFTSKNRELQAVTTTQGNLAAMAKEVDTAQEKAEKLRRKGGKAAAGKVANATADFEGSISQWESQAPFVFESLQAADETRLNHLRDALTQLQTHEVDQVERNRITAEESLNTLLNIETADEIKTFAARIVGDRPTLQSRKSRTVERDTLSPPATAAPPDDGASERSGISAGNIKSVPETPQTQRFGGLKRLGTVIGNRRKSMMPTGRTPSPDKRKAAFRGSSDVPPLPSPALGTAELGPSPPRSQRNGFQSIDGSPSHGMPRRRPSRDTPSRDESEPPLFAAPAERIMSNGSESNDRDEAQGRSSIPSSLAPPTRSEEGRKDSEGFTIPTAADDAISRAEQEAASSQPQFQLDIRNNPIQEEDRDAETALASVASALRSQAAPTRRAGTLRGRRDVRNTIFVPSPQPPDTISGEPPMPPPVPRGSRAATLATDDAANSDAQSVRSARSLGSLGNAAVRHPEMIGPGLNSSVVETVNAWFENGQVKRCVMIGELALTYNAVEATPSSDPHSLRLDNFPILEKVAPNPAFISPIPTKPGEYSIDVSNITRPTVAIKYQVHLDESTVAAHAPFTIIPTWKTEPTQASVIIHYALNESFITNTQGSITLHNLTIVVRLEGGSATACQSKPVGTFSKERSLIYWRLGDVTLERNAAPSRLLARFSTGSAAEPGRVEAQWEVSGAQAVGVGSGLTTSHLSWPTRGITASGSSETNPFSDDDATSSEKAQWREIPTMRKLMSGTYTTL
ncbi:MAG: hypothetical protein M1817_001983 [Caeruleum heppii]|nr:MAG: hypothetical protein M1817_001983 [Caeruleum heppii]